MSQTTNIETLDRPVRNTKKLTFEFVKAAIESEGYTVLSDRYVNNREKIKYRCPNGHEHSISWKEWSHHGNRCPYCSRKIKKTIEEVSDSFLSEGYILDETEYVNAFGYLKYICPNGHKHKIKWSNWSIGQRCPTCVGQIKPTIEEIEKSFNAEGYTLLSKEYRTNKAWLYYICPKGHRHHIAWIHWCHGRRCRECSYILRGINISGENSPNWKGGISCEPYCYEWSFKEFKSLIKERDGYKCLNPACSTKKESLNKLVIHHIDYDKKNCNPNNLITLCNVCNLKANYDRDWHEAWYSTIIKKRYY